MKKKKLDENINVKNIKNGLAEFKEFISRGNVVDMAVGVIIGAAFGKIVTSIVDDILMPIVGIFLGGVDFSNLSINVESATIKYGAFIQTVIDFLIVAFCIFVVVKVFERFKKKEEVVAPSKTDEVVILEEIRDLLKKENSKK